MMLFQATISLAGSALITTTGTVVKFGFAEDLPGKLLSDCGIASAILIAGIIWLALQNSGLRKAWEVDRAEMIKIIVSQSSTNSNLTMVKERLEGMITAVEARRR